MSGPATTVTVEGADTLVRTLNDASDDLENLAPEAAGRIVRDRARAAAPFVSGRLRLSLGVDTEPGRVTVGSDLIYAPVIHNGWPAHNIRANPFLIPVAEQSEAVWGKAYEVDADKAMSKVRGA